MMTAFIFLHNKKNSNAMFMLVNAVGHSKVLSECKGDFPRT